jgi:hypothetical protein
MTFLGTINDAQYAELLRRDRELLRRLTEIAKQRGFNDPDECANATKRKIFRAIQRKRSDKLNNWHYEKFKEQRNKAASKEHIQSEEYTRWLAYLVRRESNKRKRLDRDDAIEDATSTTVADLNPVEKRAVELLSGRKRKPRKNHLEMRADQLANAVQREWFSPSKRAGRPPGTNSSKRIIIKDWSYEVPLSASEVIDAVMPAIDELTGNKISGLQALIAAVKTVVPGIRDDSIARIATRIRAARIQEGARPAPLSD